MKDQPIKIDLSQQPTIECELCGHKFFKKVTIVKKISRLLTGSLEDEYAPMEVLACDKCGHVNSEFNPIKEQ